MKSKNTKPKEPVKVAVVLKPELDKIKVLKENQPKEDRFDKVDKLNQEIDLLWISLTTEFNFHLLTF